MPGPSSARRRIVGVAITATVAVAAWTSAEAVIRDIDTGSTEPSPSEPVVPPSLAEIEDLLRRFGDWVETLPQYGLPRITEDGDIVIPRAPAPSEPPPDPTRTDDGSSGITL